MPPNPKKKLDPSPEAGAPDAAADAPTPPVLPEFVEIVVEIVFRGETFTIPQHRDYWDTEGYLEWLQAWEINQYKQWILAAKILLGPRQWAKLSAMGSEGRPRAIRIDFDEFLKGFIPASTEKCEG